MSLDNLIINSGFETGSLSSWTSIDTVITSQYSHSGSFAAQLINELSYSFIYQIAPVNVGEKYEFIVSLAKVGTQPSPQISLNVIFQDAASNNLGTGLLRIIPAGFLSEANERNWIEVYQTTEPAPTGTTEALVFISKQAQAGSADIIIDDASLLAAGGTAGPTGPIGATGATGATGANRSNGRNGRNGAYWAYRAACTAKLYSTF